MLEEFAKLVIAASGLGGVVFGGAWIYDRYENILPHCVKYSEEQFYWICQNRYKAGSHCDRTTSYVLENGCARYGGEIVCGSFNITRATSTHCEEWKPWFNLRGKGERW